MGLIRECLKIVLIGLFIVFVIDTIKIYKVLKNSVGKKVEDIIPCFDRFFNRHKIYMILTFAISFIFIVVLRN